MVTAASSRVISALISLRHFPPEKTRQIYNGLDLPAVTRPKSEILEELNIEKKAKTICNVALLTARKGQLKLLEALVKLRTADKPLAEKITLVLVGDGEDRSELEAYCRKKELKGVIFTGNRDDYLDIMNACDLFVLSSIKNEDMPLVILAAMSLAKPIVATDLGGITEQLDSGKCGILINPGSSIELSEAIVSMFRNGATSEKLGKAAQKRFKRSFSMKKIMSHYSELYSSII